MKSGIFNPNLENIDGLITNKKDKVLSLTYADCTPIFLFDKSKNVIGNIHSGWQGTLNQIAKEAIKCMENSYNCNPEDIICVIGPTIRKCHFEVDEDVKNMFYNTFKKIYDLDKFIYTGKIKNGKQKYYIDTVYLNIQMLIQSGIIEKNIVDSNICTVENSKFIHSYRAERENAGRNTAIIGLI